MWEALVPHCRVADQPLAPPCCVSQDLWGCGMRNITVSVDEETYRLARIRAAELDTSVSALVRDYLTSLVRGKLAGTAGDGQPRETERERRSRLLDEVVNDITASGGGLRMADNVSRESLYDSLRVINPFRDQASG